MNDLRIWAILAAFIGVLLGYFCSTTTLGILTVIEAGFLLFFMNYALSDPGGRAPEREIMQLAGTVVSTLGPMWLTWLLKTA